VNEKREKERRRRERAEESVQETREKCAGDQRRGEQLPLAEYQFPGLSFPVSGTF